MNVEEALMLLDRICENDSSNNDTCTCTYDVDHVIALNSVEAFPLNIQDEISLGHVKDCTIPNTFDRNNNSLKIPKIFSKKISMKTPMTQIITSVMKQMIHQMVRLTWIPLEMYPTDSAPENAEKIDNTEHGSAQIDSLIDKDTGGNMSISVNRSRKRTRQEDQWRKNIRKTQRQVGKQYKDSKGNVKRQREI